VISRPDPVPPTHFGRTLQALGIGSIAAHTPGLVEAVCLAGTPEEIVERVRTLEKEGLRQIMLYPPLNRQYRVIEDFASMVMSRL